MSSTITTAVRMTVALALALTAWAALTTTRAEAAGVPRYVVSVTQLKAIEEQNEHDWAMDEDVYGGFQVTNSDTGKHLGAFRTQLLKGFDEGETKTLDADKRCVPAGEILAFKSGREFLDARSGDRWLCQTINAQGVGLQPPFSVAGTLYTTVPCYDFVADCNRYRDSVRGAYDEIDIHLGGARLDFSPGGLYIDLPQAGMQRTYLMDHRNNHGHYRTFVTVQRVA